MPKPSIAKSIIRLSVWLSFMMPLAAFAGTVTYTTQTRTASAYAIYASPDSVAATDFLLFDEYVVANGALGDHADATHVSSLMDDGLSVELNADVYAENFDFGSAEAVSVFDVVFTIDEATRFDVTGLLTEAQNFGPKFDFLAADFVLETEAGEEIVLDWQPDGYAGFDYVEYTLNSRVLLSAGNYRLRMEAAADVRCSETEQCFDFGAGTEATALFSMTVVPVPAAILLFPSALLVLVRWRRHARVR